MSLLPAERPVAGPVGLVDILEDAESRPDGLEFTDTDRLSYVRQRPQSDEIYDGLRLIARVDNSERIGHQVYEPSLAATIRTDGDGPGGATGLYLIDGIFRRLSPREAARTHSIDEQSISALYKFMRDNPSLDAERELFRFIGNSTPARTLDAAISHLLPLLRW